MKLIPVEMTIKEKIQHLMDGEVFYTKRGSKIFYDENSSGNPFRFQDTILNHTFASQWYKEQAWHDNISEKGVPCWVWDDDEEERYLRLIVEVRDRTRVYAGFIFLQDDREIYWKNAIPVTKEELFGG